MRPPGLAVVVLVAVLGCGKKDGDAWGALVKQHAAAIDKLREQVLAASAEVDKNPDAKAYPPCQRSAAHRFAPLGNAEEHTIDFVDEARLVSAGLQGFHNSRTVGFNYLSDPSTLTYALMWTHDQGKSRSGPPTAKDKQRFAAAAGVNSVVLFREKPESNSKSIKIDSFLVSLDPPKVSCVISVEADGQSVTVAGTPVENWVETTYNVETGQTLSVREFQTGGGGGTFTNNATAQAHEGYADLALLQLGFSPFGCTDDGSCVRYDTTRCDKGTCVPDTAKREARAKSYERSKPIFEATRAIHDECELAKAAADSDRTAVNACIDKLWAALEAEGARVGVTKEELGEHHDAWVKTLVPAGPVKMGTLTCDEVVPAALREAHGLTLLGEEKHSEGTQTICSFNTKTNPYVSISVSCSRPEDASTPESGLDHYRTQLKAAKPLAAGKQALIGDYLGTPMFVIVDDDTPCYFTGDGGGDALSFAKGIAAALNASAFGS